MVYPQISKDRGYSLPAPINCQSTNVIYLIICSCGKYYVGRTEHPRPRWSNHKCHIRKGVTSCNLASHCEKNHKHLVGDDKLFDVKEIRSAFKLILLEALGDDSPLEELKKKEETWRNRLESWAPVGLNTREDWVIFLLVILFSFLFVCGGNFKIRRKKDLFLCGGNFCVLLCLCVAATSKSGRKKYLFVCGSRYCVYLWLLFLVCVRRQLLILRKKICLCAEATSVFWVRIFSVFAADNSDWILLVEKKRGLNGKEEK